MFVLFMLVTEYFHIVIFKLAFIVLRTFFKPWELNLSTLENGIILCRRWAIVLYLLDLAFKKYKQQFFYLIKKYKTF